MRVTDPQGIEIEIRSRACANLLPDRLWRDQASAPTENAAPGLGLELEGGEPH